MNVKKKMKRKNIEEGDEDDIEDEEEKTEN